MTSLATHPAVRDSPTVPTPPTNPDFGTLAGALAAATIAGSAWRAGSLTASGTVAAIVVGTCATAAGWEWAVVLIFFFLTSSALSRWNAATKHARAGGRVEKQGARDATQVLANGGIFAACAVGASMTPSPVISAAGFGALAAATADTWATEIGMSSHAIARSIATLRPVAPGTSGGVTAAGTGAGMVGACAIAGVVAALGFDRGLAVAVAAGGVAGMVADSLVGATLQAMQWCNTCNVATEARVHRCGAATTHARGVRWINNDIVNICATVVGSLVSLAVIVAQ